ncbi:MAG: S9 family peptidase [Woeseiaceae bacterium]|nr:S9 family peptidase [Woeseiaceae bacterium]
MRRTIELLITGSALGLLAACGGTDQGDGEDAMNDQSTTAFHSLEAEAPVADIRPVEIEQHGDVRVDNYAWLRDEEWQEVLRDPEELDADIRAHLDAENAFYEAAAGDLAELRDALFSEMRGRVKEDDSSVPMPDGEYAYGRRFREGGEYPIFFRTPRGGGEETILFDGDAESEGSDFFRVIAVQHSPDHELIAYGVDRLGSEYYDIRVRNIETDEEYVETVGSTSGGAVWAADSKSFYYIERDDNQRPKFVRRHVLGTPQDDDEIVYEETDDTMFLGVGKSQSGDYIFISSSKGSTSEYRFLRADAPAGTEPVLLAPSVEDELYAVDHHGDYFYIRTNQGDAIDFKIVRAPVDDPGRDNWEEWLPYQPGVYVQTFVTYADYLVRLEQENALPRIVVSDYSGESSYEIDFEEEAYVTWFSGGYEFDTDTLRMGYQSPSTPEEQYDFNLASRERELVKTQEIPSGHDSSLYAVERLFVTAEDGAEIPVTVLRLRTTPTDGTAPLLLYGYGSYGYTIPAWFSSDILSIVDRGAIYAVGHIRGGSANGRQWYLDGKMENKKNTFSDFAAVAEDLQERGYGRPGETVIYGGSAGGLLVGATVNLRPDLFGGVIAAVPFVDVVNTISDAELPLTPPEWVEWGDPITDPEAYRTILAYSPYENIRSDVDYPPILATGGLTDYRVTYWEPAKWVARLREEASGGPFFLKMNMGAGHAGSAGRFERRQERAHDYAFALRVMGLEDAEPISHGSADPS